MLIDEDLEQNIFHRDLNDTFALTRDGTRLYIITRDNAKNYSLLMEIARL